ncbi:Uncharacterised protein [Mycobacteroides abscessus]|nr:Uncharacterised protein [Mycobacteroides abscessus]
MSVSEVRLVPDTQFDHALSVRLPFTTPPTA